MKHKALSAQIVVPCANLDETLRFFIEEAGFRLEMIFPADRPSVAVVAGYGINLRLEKAREIQPLKLNLSGDFPTEIEREMTSPDGLRVCLIDEQTKLEIPDGKPELVVSNLENVWHAGRAGMEYRDLIPNRLGGRFIASHIRIEKGGAVADYVHFHKIRFQMIYCLTGWARLVYEDQGAAFLMNAGDCVLQPPEIRHRVLECSDKFEVLEIGCPAVHETFAEHQITLPNAEFNPNRIFGGQRFVRQMAKKAVWKDTENFEMRDTGIFAATGGLADVRVLRAKRDAEILVKHTDEFLFFYVLKGKLNLSGEAGENFSVEKNGSFVLPGEREFSIVCEKGLEIIRVSLGGKER